MKRLLLALVFLALVFPTVALGKIGVGVATGKIQVQEKLKPGIIYNLPPLTVLNTGDESSDYEVAVTLMEKQPQLKPANDWFIFSPQRFHLDPGKVQIVKITLNLPVAIKPGDYFGFLEAHPVKKDSAGNTTVGIAAATKLYFTIVPANMLEAIYYKVSSFWTIYQPYTGWAAIVIVILAVILIVKKFLHIEVNLKKKDKHNAHSGKQDE